VIVTDPRHGGVVVQVKFLIEGIAPHELNRRLAILIVNPKSPRQEG
jgi:hypothetical protein